MHKNCVGFAFGFILFYRYNTSCTNVYTCILRQVLFMMVLKIFFWLLRICTELCACEFYTGSNKLYLISLNLYLTMYANAVSGVKGIIYTMADRQVGSECKTTTLYIVHIFFLPIELELN